MPFLPFDDDVADRVDAFRDFMIYANLSGAPVPGCHVQPIRNLDRVCRSARLSFSYS